ncbi:carbamoyltransferase HypF, partial [Myxococcota bacterium]|nr:carbamoyltransferase HypF [Myxococcota bacterium]
VLRALLQDQASKVAISVISSRFHNALIKMATDVALWAQMPRIGLSGGVFQNRFLSTRLSASLREAGFEVLVHEHLPPNDGAISVGQSAVVATRWLADNSLKDS